MKISHLYKFPVFLILFFALFIFETRAQNVKRVVIVKVDGLSGDFVEKYVEKKDARTGKSVLPWFEHIFYKNGTRVSNFYSRGMSLSAPSWSLLDTGRHLQIKGNVEYDRLIFSAYDYLNFIPYYVNYGKKERVDMPGMEVLDQMKTPILSDAFPYENRYTSFQLFQRGTDWGVISKGFLGLFPKNASDFIDEWTIGFDFYKTTIEQHERDILKKLDNSPEIDYFDYYSTEFDHISHLNKNEQARLNVLKDLDKTLGRLWIAVKNSERADETALIIVSDHGFNSDKNTYSQGFNIVNLLKSREGGGHHVVTKRHLMLDYSVKGLNPFVPLITNKSVESFYLKNQAEEYPTIMLDFDGNERASLHLRDNDLNVLQIIFQQLQSKNLSESKEKVLRNGFFQVVNKRRENWQKTVDRLEEELSAVRLWIEKQNEIIKAQPEKFTVEQFKKGLDKEARRIVVQKELAEKDEIAYREYLYKLKNLLNLKPETFEPRKLKIENFIAKGAMGERNSIFKLQNYVVGLSENGFVIGENGELDFEKSFERRDYFELLKSQMVKNSVQKKLGTSPIDFVAAAIPLEEIFGKLPPNLKPDQNPIWIYGGKENQALLLAKKSGGTQNYFYLPISDLRQNKSGEFSFAVKDWSSDFPLKIYEDENFDAADKTVWLSNWQTENEWMRATHKARYSNAVVNLFEQFGDHFADNFTAENNKSEDENLMRRFRIHQRNLTKTDLLILANDHWNFDVRGFNAGGNHGSFFRISSNSILMFAGGSETEIPRGLEIEKPYDNLSFVPTILRLMGKIDENNQPNEELREKGFRRFPGKVIEEILTQQR